MNINVRKIVRVSDNAEGMGYDVKVSGESDVSATRGDSTSTALAIDFNGFETVLRSRVSPGETTITFVVTGAIERMLLAEVFETAAKVLKKIDQKHAAEDNIFMEG